MDWLKVNGQLETFRLRGVRWVSERRFLKKLERELLHGPAIPLLGIYPKEVKRRLKEISVHPSTEQCCSQEPRVGITQMSPGGRMDEQSGMCTCIGISVSLKKGGSFDACYGVGELRRHYVKGNKPVAKRHVL